jgi:nucleotide-binding universal stress UspA family protein
MFQRILVPLDGSPRAERAIPIAARLARNSGGCQSVGCKLSPLSAHVVLEQITFSLFRQRSSSILDQCPGACVAEPLSSRT